MFTRKNNNNNIKARMNEITHILNSGLFASDADCVALMDEWYRLFYQSQPKETSNAMWKALWEDPEWRAKKIAQLRQPRKR